MIISTTTPSFGRITVAEFDRRQELTMERYIFCPQCSAELIDSSDADDPDISRRVCPDAECGFVHYDNPTPVVAALVEAPDATVVLVRNHGWPDDWYGLVTGFLEAGEDPEAGIRREIREELGVDSTVVAPIGQYDFEAMNQVILVYHVRIETTAVTPGSDVAEAKRVPIRKLKPWPMGTGQAVAEWLEHHRGTVAVDDAPPGITFTRGASAFSIEELADLYASVGWTRHAESPDLLRRALDGSHLVVTASDEKRDELVGLLRVVSDGAWIAYLQEILVRPSHQGRGVGRALMNVFLDRYDHLRQKVLLTDDRPDQHAFYGASGFLDITHTSPALHAFVRMEGLEPSGE